MMETGGLMSTTTPHGPPRLRSPYHRLPLPSLHEGTTRRAYDRHDLTPARLDSSTRMLV